MDTSDIDELHEKKDAAYKEYREKINAANKEYAVKKVNQINNLAKDIRGDIKGLSDTIGEIKIKIDDNLNGKISDIPDDLGQKFQDIHANIDNRRKELGEEISAVSKNLDGKFASVETKISGLEGKVAGIPENLSGKFDSVETRISGLEGKVDGIPENLSGKFTGVENRISGLEGKVDGVSQNISVVNDNIIKLGGVVDEILRIQREVQAKLAETEAQLSAKQNEINRLTGEVSEAKAKIGSLNNQIDEKIKAANSLRHSLDTAYSERNSAEKSLSVWKDAVEIYVPVREALRNCETFRNLLEQRGLTDDSEIGLFTFVQELGKTMDFLGQIHTVAVDAKKQQGANPQLMTYDEAEVYRALNRCYRKIWNVDFDVFTTPGSRKSLDAPFEKTEFNKDEAFYMKDMRNKSLRYTINLYVPLLLNREGKPSKMAYVDASNL